MVSSWQLWLSPRPIGLTNFALEPAIFGEDNAIHYDFIQEDDGRRVVQETHYIDKKIVRDGLSGPPLHIHMRQTEYFHVQKGTLGVVMNGKEHVLTKDDPPVMVNPGVRHTFWAHASSQDDVVFKVWVDPQDVDSGFDEGFMRNFTGYLVDCKKENISPSIFQILLFLYNSDIILTPPFWFPIWLLAALHHFLGYWAGAGVLGYKPSYPEYSREPSTKNSKKVS